MNTMTPDDLRQVHGAGAFADELIRVAANTWEAAIKCADYAKGDKVVMQNEIDVLREQLERAKKQNARMRTHLASIDEVLNAATDELLDAAFAKEA